MDDGLNSQSPGQFIGGGGGIPMSLNNSKQHDEHSHRNPYSMPGLLHYLQTEWARFEMDRAQWDVEKAELEARIAFLQGERKGQENLKHDLVRRIKMLEYALKQERQKYHKLKYGTDLVQGDVAVPNFENEDKDDSIVEDYLNQQNSTNMSWKQGRQLLRQYLQEIGYSDTIIDVRSARVRQLLGLQSLNERHLINGESANKRPSDVYRGPPNKKFGLVDSVLKDAQVSAMKTFDFLHQPYSQEEEEEEDNLSDGEDDMLVDEDEDNEVVKKKPKTKATNDPVDADLVGPEADVMSEFDFLQDQSEGGGESVNEDDDWGVNPQTISSLTEEYKKERTKINKKGQRPRRADLKAMLDNLGSDIEASEVSTTQKATPRPSNNNNDMEEGRGELAVFDDGPMNSGLGLGDLAGLTVQNEAEISYDIASPQEALRRTWSAKYTLRSHFDGIRALAFHPVEAVLLTASEDHTLKLWNLQKTVQAKKTASLDVEPVYTFRGHNGPVLSLAVASSGAACFSGGVDGSIRGWAIPNPNIDPYDTYDGGVSLSCVVGHSDAVWGLTIHPSRSHLLSCSSDGTVKLWDVNDTTPTLLSTFSTKDEEDGTPTSVSYISTEVSRLVVSYSESNAHIFDIETGKVVINLEKHDTKGGIHVPSQINRILSHPTLPLLVTAHEDRHIRFYDSGSGKLVHSMVAHLDAVTSLAIDPNGLYLLSGSHDCSIRLWNMDSRTCVQEITSHRKKFDESIHDVAFHPSKSFLASAGADALAKVFVCV